jgi:hypothetical protein
MSSTSTQSIHQKGRPAPARIVIVAKSRKTLGKAFTMLWDFDAGVGPRDALAHLTLSFLSAPRLHGIERRDQLGAVDLFHADLDCTGREGPARDVNLNWPWRDGANWLHGARCEL